MDEAWYWDTDVQSVWKRHPTKTDSNQRWQISMPKMPPDICKSTKSEPPHASPHRKFSILVWCLSQRIYSESNVWWTHEKTWRAVLCVWLLYKNIWKQPGFRVSSFKTYRDICFSLWKMSKGFPWQGTPGKAWEVLCSLVFYCKPDWSGLLFHLHLGGQESYKYAFYCRKCQKGFHTRVTLGKHDHSVKELLRQQWRIEKCRIVKMKNMRGGGVIIKCVNIVPKIQKQDGSKVAFFRTYWKP